jgi:hypothetical protein
MAINQYEIQKNCLPLHNFGALSERLLRASSCLTAQVLMPKKLLPAQTHGHHWGRNSANPVEFVTIICQISGMLYAFVNAIG